MRRVRNLDQLFNGGKQFPGDFQMIASKEFLLNSSVRQIVYLPKNISYVG